MSKPARKHQERHTFTKGERLHLDDIYSVQGLGGGDWWSHDPPDDDCADSVIITRSVRITVTVTELDSEARD